MAHDLVFANARVKARENNILTRDKLFRMIESDLPEAFSMLSEVGYSVESADIDEICANEEKKLVEFMIELEVGKVFVNCLVSEYDYKALKRAFKMKVQRQDFEFSPLTVGGFIPLDKIKSSVYSDDYELFPDSVKSVLRELDLKSVTDKVAPSEVETRIDDTMYKEYLRVLSGKDGYDYYSRRVFMTNLITLIRVNKLGLDSEFFDSRFVGDKDREWERMSRLVGESTDAIIEEYRVGDYSEIVQALSSGDIDAFETYADDMLIKDASSHKAEMFSQLLLAGYFIAKRAEIQNVRLILTCIKNKVDASEVTKRLRACYYD